MISYTEIEKIGNDYYGKYDELYVKLSTILSKVDMYEVISALSFVTYSTQIEGVSSIQPVLLEFLVGICTGVISKGKEKPSSTEILSVWNLCDELLENQIGINIFGAIRKEDDENETYKKVFAASLKNSYSFARGYSHFTYIEKKNIKRIFKEFNSKIEKLIGFYPEEVFTIIDAYRRIIPQKINLYMETIGRDRLKEVDEKEGYSILFSGNLNEVMSFTLEELCEEIKSEVSDSHVLAFLEFFSFEFEDNINFVEKYKYATDDNYFSFHPILRQGEKYSIPNFQLILWNMREIFEEEIKRDGKWWNEYDKKHKAKFLEEESISIIKKILPQCEIYSSLYYQPEDEETPCELDALAKYDNILILVEAKGGNYSRPARRGGLKRLESVIEKNLQYAYKQGDRTRRYIKNSNKAVFYLDRNLKHSAVTIETKDIKDIFIINTTVDYYAELGVDLYKLKELGIYKEQEFPWTVCISDLEVISDFIDFPNQFLYYMLFRRELNNNIGPNNRAKLLYELDLLAMYKFENTEMFNQYNLDEAMDEIDLFIAHENDGEEIVESCVTKDYSAFYFKFYQEYESTGIKPYVEPKKYNERFIDMCRQLEEYNAKGFSAFIFRFLDMDLDDQDWLFKNIDEICNLSIRDNKMHVLTIKQMPSHFLNSPYGMVIYVGFTKDRKNIERRAYQAGLIQQGQTGIKDWITLCIYLDDDRHFINQFYYHFGTEESKKLVENIVKHIPVTAPKKIYPNALCPCGSGLKYKKCCGR